MSEKGELGCQGPPGPEPEPKVKQRDARDSSLKKIIEQKRNRSAFSAATGKVTANVKMVRMRNTGRGR